MAKPYSIYFRKDKTGSPVIDTNAKWKIVCKDFPFKPSGEAKELSKRDWSDENGEDTYFPSELKIKAYDLDVEFAYKGNVNTANTQIKNFLDYLTGVSDIGTSLSVYDTYTNIGRKGIYFKSINPDLFVRKTDEGDVVTFKITFRVTDPITQITLNG